MGNTGQGVAGSANTGGGGGGGWNQSGRAGGSGVVLIRVPSTHSYASTVGSPGTSTSGGYNYLAFTSSGTVTL